MPLQIGHTRLGPKQALQNLCKSLWFSSLPAVAFAKAGALCVAVLNLLHKNGRPVPVSCQKWPPAPHPGRPPLPDETQGCGRASLTLGYMRPPLRGEEGGSLIDLQCASFVLFVIFCGHGMEGRGAPGRQRRVILNWATGRMPDLP